MKELYLNPEMNVVNFSVEDIITTSTNTPSQNPLCPNEGEMGTGWL